MIPKLKYLVFLDFNNVTQLSRKSHP